MKAFHLLAGGTLSDEVWLAGRRAWTGIGSHRV